MLFRTSQLLIDCGLYSGFVNVSIRRSFFSKSAGKPQMRRLVSFSGHIHRIRQQFVEWI